MKKGFENKVGVVGEITGKFYDQRTLTKKQKDKNKRLEFWRHNVIDKLPSATLRIFFYKRFASSYNLGKLTKIHKRTNVICNAGFNTITKRLTGEATSTCHINKALLGAGVGSASASDTQLINETYRNDVASATDDANKAILTVFFTEGEVAGTFKEFGNCIDGEAGANTGELWSHITGLNWVKDTNTALVISCKYTFQSS